VPQFGTMDTAKLGDALPSARRYARAMSLFQRGTEIYARDLQFTDEAARLIGEAMLTEARAINFRAFFDQVDGHSSEGFNAKLAALRTSTAQLKPEEMASLSAEARQRTRDNALLLSCFMRCSMQEISGRMYEQAERGIGEDVVEMYKTTADLDGRMSALATACAIDDPRAWRWLASANIAVGEVELADTALEKSIAIAGTLAEDDERKDGWYAGYYILATVKENLSPNLEDISKAEKGEKSALIEKYIEKGEKVLKLYEQFLEHSSDCHHFVPIACFMRGTIWVKLRCSTQGTNAQEVVKHGGNQRSRGRLGACVCVRCPPPNRTRARAHARARAHTHAHSHTHARARTHTRIGARSAAQKSLTIPLPPPLTHTQ